MTGGLLFAPTSGVGRDILLGAVNGAGMILIYILSNVAPRWIGQPFRLTINPGNLEIAHVFFTRFATQLSAALFVAFIALVICLALAA